MVDVSPFGGDYSGVVVTNNTIAGGFASESAQGSETSGTNNNDVIIKYVYFSTLHPRQSYTNQSRIGIAIGPRTWFGNEYGNNVSTGGTVQDNQLTGAFSYGMAMSSATNFTVESNVLIGNTSFIGARGPNCTSNDPTPTTAAFVIDLSNVQKSMTQLDFTPVSDGDSLTCVVPPAGGDYWPFGGNPNSNAPPVSPPEPAPTTSSSHLSAGTTAGIVVGAIAAVILVAVITWFVRNWALKRSEVARIYPRSSMGYVRQKF